MVLLLHRRSAGCGGAEVEAAWLFAGSERQRWTREDSAAAGEAADFGAVEAPGRPAEAEEARIDGGSLDSNASRRQSASADSAAPPPTPPVALAPVLAASSARTSEASSISRVSGSIDWGVTPTEPRRSKRNWAGKVLPAAAPPPLLPPPKPPPPPNEDEELTLLSGGSSPSAALAIALSNPLKTPASSLRSRAIDP